MGLVAISNIDDGAHTCDVKCNNPEYDGGAGCTYEATGVDVNAQFAYAPDGQGGTTTDCIIVECPTCGQVSSYPTTDPKNVNGYALGQAKTA
jgi:hypothetical protein